MWSRAELKENAKVTFKRNYWNCVAVSVIAALLCGEMGSGANGFKSGFETAVGENEFFTSSGFFGIFTVALIIAALLIFVLSTCFWIFVGNIAEVGRARYYMENREHQTRISQLFYGFRSGRYRNVLLTMFLQKLYVFLWMLLLIVPGIIKSYAYMLVPYILSENPDMDHRRALSLSEQMMNGHKMDAFVLALSFFGWAMLSVCTCGILEIFYVRPYIDATLAEFYAAIKTEAMQRGITSEYELPGHYYEVY